MTNAQTVEARTPRHRKRRRIALLIGATTLALSLCWWLAAAIGPAGGELPPPLRDALDQPGKTITIGAEKLQRPLRTSASPQTSARVRVEAALRARDFPGAARILRRAHAIRLIVLAKPGEGLPSPWSFGRIPGYAGVHFSSRGNLYRRASAPPCHRHGAVLSRIARAVLSGRGMPATERFPAEFRRAAPVELMIMLRQGERPVLWRSARANHCAAALRTATAAAQARWRQRLESRSGPLSAQLDALSVELWDLRADGYIASNQRRLIDRAVQTDQGVGFEYRNRWHYVLPEVLDRQQVAASTALARLLASKGIDRTRVPAERLRVFRLEAKRLGTSLPEHSRASRSPGTKPGLPGSRPAARSTDAQAGGR